MASESESDLEFESADEDLNAEDIDTSDLDLDDDDDDHKNKKTSKKGETELTKPAKIVEKISKTKEPEPVKETKSFEKITKKEETSDELDKNDKYNNEPVSNKTEKILETNNWDADADFSDIKEEKNEEKITTKSKNNEPHSDGLAPKMNKNKVDSGWDADVDFSDIEENTEEKINKKFKNNEPKTTKKKVDSGWDAEADFSDIEEDLTNKTKSLEIKSTQNPVKSNENIKKSSLFEEKEKKVVEDTSNSWGVGWSSFLSKATQGINTVIESVEATIGAPHPEQMAKIALKEEEIIKKSQNISSSEINKNKDENNDWINDDNGQEWFATQIMKSGGGQIMSGGLDVLESVGRKTFQVLSDKDQNLKQTREFLKNVPTKITSQKPNLSQLLREAQDSKNSNDSTTRSNTTQSNQREPTFAYFFDEYIGSVHLEALEMLSQQSNVKLEILSKPTNLKTYLLKIDQFFDQEKLNDEEQDNDENELENNTFFENETFLNDFKNLIVNKTFSIECFENLINKYAKSCHFHIDLEKIISAFRETNRECTKIKSASKLLNESIRCFALITSRITEFYHKTAEYILIEHNQRGLKKSQNTIENVEAIYQITKLCLRSLTILADEFCKIAWNGEIEREKSCNQIITEIYLESSNSCTFIVDAYLLLSPIVKSHVLSK